MESFNFQAAVVKKPIKKRSKNIARKLNPSCKINKLRNIRVIAQRCKKRVKTISFQENKDTASEVINKNKCCKIKHAKFVSVTNWTEDISKIFTNLSINQIDVSVSGSKFFSGHYKDHIMTSMTWDGYLKYTGDMKLYIAQLPLYEKNKLHELNSVRKVLGQFNLIKFCESFNNNIDKINIWISKTSTKSTLHYDSYDNFLFLLKGVKKFTLYPPNCEYICCESVTTNSFQQARIIDKRANKYKIEILLKEGEAIFIPQGWYHKVDSYGVDSIIAVNVWFNSITKLCNDREKYLLRYVMKKAIEDEVKTKLFSVIPKNKLFIRDIDLNPIREYMINLDFNSINNLILTIERKDLREFILLISKMDKKFSTHYLLNLSHLLVEHITGIFEEMDQTEINDNNIETDKSSSDEFYSQLFELLDFETIQKTFLQKKIEFRKQILESIIVQKLINSYEF